MLHPQTLPLGRAFEQASVTTWLIGGQAVEVLCGGDVRPHDDIDFLVRLTDAPAALRVLESLGFSHAHGSLRGGNVFYRRGDLLVDLVPIDDALHPPRTVGELVNIPWPADLLTPHFAGEVRTLTPQMHLEMKRLVAAFYGTELRGKDRVDCAALSTLLT